MGSVTSVVFVMNSMLEDRGKRKGQQFIDRLNNYFADDSEDSPQHDKTPFVEVGEFAGGTKGVWGNIYIKGCNYLDLDDFLNWLVSQKWYYPDQMQILIHREWKSDQIYHHKLVSELIQKKEWSEVNWKYSKH